jgi:hypothetical protein
MNHPGVKPIDDELIVSVYEGEPTKGPLGDDHLPAKKGNSAYQV